MTRSARRCFAAILVATGVLLPGCSEQAPGDDSTAAATAPEIRHTYVVRGLVVTVPSAERPMDDLEIRHEAIPGYKNRDGEVFVNSKGRPGMGSMTMGFPVAKGVSLESIAPGDPVEFTFVVSWGETYPTYEVTEIRKLPPDTELDFSGGMGDD